MPPTLPRMEAYLASLPGSLASYPDCVQKASVYREFIRFMPTGALAGKVPKPVEALVTSPVAAAAWVPEVHVTALYLAISDLELPDEAAFVARAEVANKELLTGPLYRIMMMVASPAYLAKNAESRWNTFHRGIKMTAESLPQGKSGTAVFRLDYPKALVPELIARANTTAFKAAIEAAGGRGVKVELTRFGPESSTLACSWS